MAGGTPHTANGLYAVGNARPLRIPLHRMPSAKRQSVICSRLPVYRHAGCLLQHDISFAVIGNAYRPCEKVNLFQYAIVQLYLQIRRAVLQRDDQCLRLLFRSIRGRKARQAVLSLCDLVAHIPECGGRTAIRILDLQRTDSVISRPKTAVFLGQCIQRIRTVHAIRIPGKASVPTADPIGLIRPVRLLSVISMQQCTLSVRFHLVRCVLRL